MKIINFSQEDSSSINFDNTETQLPSGICARDLYIKRFLRIFLLFDYLIIYSYFFNATMYTLLS